MVLNVQQLAMEVEVCDGKITERVFLYELGHVHGYVLARAESEIPENHLAEFSNAVSFEAALKRGRAIVRVTDEDEVQRSIKRWREIGAVKQDGTPWDLEEAILKDPALEYVRVFEGIRFWIVFETAPSC